MVNVKATEVIAILGGTCWIPRAFLRMPNMMTILRNEVPMTTKIGSSDRRKNITISVIG
ncbi:hypothetical protein MA13_contig00011-0064 [Edwardsiella piscicida]|nr:hypothetical protein MA13_contig00011-0064 [Edwardsiella piscicida]